MVKVTLFVERGTSGRGVVVPFDAAEWAPAEPLSDLTMRLALPQVVGPCRMAVRAALLPTASIDCLPGVAASWAFETRDSPPDPPKPATSTGPPPDTVHLRYRVLRPADFDSFFPAADVADAPSRRSLSVQQVRCLQSRFGPIPQLPPLQVLCGARPYFAQSLFQLFKPASEVIARYASSSGGCEPGPLVPFWHYSRFPWSSIRPSPDQPRQGASETPAQPSDSPEGQAQAQAPGQPRQEASEKPAQPSDSPEGQTQARASAQTDSRGAELGQDQGQPQEQTPGQSSDFPQGQAQASAQTDSRGAELRQDQGQPQGQQAPGQSSDFSEGKVQARASAQTGSGGTELGQDPGQPQGQQTPGRPPVCRGDWCRTYFFYSSPDPTGPLHLYPMERDGTLATEPPGDGYPAEEMEAAQPGSESSCVFTPHFVECSVDCRKVAVDEPSVLIEVEDLVRTVAGILMHTAEWEAFSDVCVMNGMVRPTSDWLADIGLEKALIPIVHFCPFAPVAGFCYTHTFSAVPEPRTICLTASAADRWMAPALHSERAAVISRVARAFSDAPPPPPSPSVLRPPPGSAGPLAKEEVAELLDPVDRAVLRRLVACRLACLNDPSGMGDYVRSSVNTAALQYAAEQSLVPESVKTVADSILAAFGT
ncbi:hypothetical protein DIPPA_16615 [Diplonema papillatum]|nr:hypothetical protein DIPPA_16615 [Diplonema papillatum]